MREVVITAALRTPVGKYRGTLSGVRADALGAVVLNGLLARSGLRPGQIEDVIFGCVTQVGEQSANIARTALLAAGWPESIPGMTVDRKCGSSEAAVHIAAAMIASGARDIVIAGGAESMSRVRMGGNREIYGEAFGRHLVRRFDMVSQGEASERIAERWGIGRDEMDRFALSSHQRAAAAADSGRFASQIVTVDLGQWSESGDGSGIVTADETIRRQTSLGKLAALQPSFRPDGHTTAGNASQIADGAAGLLLMDRATAEQLGLRPLAILRAGVTVGSDPTLMLTGPVEATRQALSAASVALGQVDLYEVNEAFAPVPLMWLRELGADPDRLNVNGGAIALGHPLGGSGARLMVTLIHELHRRNALYGLQTMCGAGGLGTATVLERA